MTIKLTLKAAKEKARDDYHASIVKDAHNEYRVSLHEEQRDEAKRYYTNDLADALATARAKRKADVTQLVMRRAKESREYLNDLTRERDASNDKQTHDEEIKNTIVDVAAFDSLCKAIDHENVEILQRERDAYTFEENNVRNYLNAYAEDFIDALISESEAIVMRCSLMIHDDATQTITANEFSFTRVDVNALRRKATARDQRVVDMLAAILLEAIDADIFERAAD